MKVIFLDIDGVLNHLNFLLSTDDISSLDSSCLFCLRHLVDKTGASLVLSSSWRRSKNKIKYLEEKIGIKFFDVLGFNFDERGKEIDYWLKTHENYNIKNYVILDDEDSDIEDKQHLVKTEFNNGGLKLTHVNLAIKMLGKKAK